MRTIALFVLVIGLSAGATIYFTAEEPAPSAYIIVGDTAYAYDPSISKQYQRQLERFGGKAAVLFDDFNRWFSSLWVWKQLGITVVFLTGCAAGLLFWIAKARSGGAS